MRSSTVDASRTHFSSEESQTLEQEAPLLGQNNDTRYSSLDNRDSSPAHAQFSREISKSEVQRGKIMSFLSAGVIVLAWILFMTTAWAKLGQSKEELH